MTSEHWQKVKGLFEAALELSPAKREKFLRHACAGNAELRREVENLLKSFDRSEDFLEKPAVKEVASLIIEKNTKLKSGERLANYEIILPIGEGGMGEVYLAKDVRLNRKIALKVLPANLTADKSRLQRFEQEAQAASALNHPNILTIYEIGEFAETHFIATEFVEGETLRQKISGGNLQTEEILDIAAQIASALAIAHTAGVVHRDIKPENVMIRPDSLVKLLDFGLAKLIGFGNADLGFGIYEKKTLTQSASKNPPVQIPNHKLTNPGMVMGTVNYMSPEQARGAHVDHRTDLWSLGVCLYEMLSGNLPFAGKTINHTLVAVMEAEPPDLRAINPNIPVEAERIVKKLLAKKSAGRYQTAHDLLSDLRQLQKNIESLASAATKTLSAVSAEKANRITSIAVLPFSTFGFAADEEYLGIGLADALITQLSKTRQLTVRPTDTVRNRAAENRDFAEIGRELCVGAILAGNLQRLGERLRLTVQLIETETNAMLWAEKFKINLADFFEVQDQIAEKVSSALFLQLNTDEQTQLTKRYTDNNAAYLEYLKGRYFWDKRDLDGFRRATEHFQAAIDHDPTYALAYTGLADVYCLLAVWGEAAPHEILPRARAAALRALEIDDQLAEAHASLGQVKYIYDWDWTGVEKSYRRAIALNPNYGTVHSWLAKLYTLTHRFDEALKELQLAQRLDPLSLQFETSMGAVYLYSRQFDRAIEKLRKVLEINSKYVPAYISLGTSLARRGEFSEALAAHEKAVELSGNHPVIEGFLGCTLAFAGKREKALKIARDLEQMVPANKTLIYSLASVYACLNEKEKAFAWLERGFDEHETNLPGISMELEFDNLRGDPRFAEMLRRLGLERKFPGESPNLSPPRSAENKFAATHSGETNTLAVLPFATVGLSADEEYLSLGLADALITQLSRTKQLAVRPTSAVRGLVNAPQSAASIGSRLHVGSILEGSLQRAGERMRVTVQLVDTTSETSLWAEKFLFEFTDIFDVQDEIATQVSKALLKTFTSDEFQKLTARGTDNVEAYQIYLKARFYLHRSEPDALSKAVSLFREAITLAPAYAEAYAGLAEAYIFASYLSEPKESLQKAREAAQKAIELNINSAEAHVALGVCKWNNDWNWREAEEELKNALRLDPNYPPIYRHYGLLLVGLRRFDEAFRMFEKGLKLDPLSLPLNAYYALAFVAAGEAERAIDQCRRTLELDANFLPALGFLAQAFWLTGDFQSAIETSIRQCQIQKAPITLANLAHLYGCDGQTAKARKILGELEAEKEKVHPIYFALIHLGLGEKESVWKYLERAYSERSVMFVAWLNSDVRLQTLRSETRFQELLRRMNLTP